MIGVPSFFFTIFLLAILIVFSGQSKYARLPSSVRSRLRRLELKADAIIQHLGIELQEDSLKGGLSIKVRDLVDDGMTLRAIRAYREETGASREDARKAVVAYLRR